VKKNSIQFVSDDTEKKGVAPRLLPKKNGEKTIYVPKKPGKFSQKMPQGLYGIKW